MQKRFDFWYFLYEILFVIIMHVIISIALKMLDRYVTHSQTILLRAFSLLTAYFRVSVANLTFLLVYTYVLALRQISNPLGFVFTDPNIIVFLNILRQF